MKAVFESLNLNAANFHDEGSPIANFYNNFKIENSLYCPRKLSSLGVLLGKGSIIEKANVLFKNYDTSVSDSLEYNEILVLITDILEIALIFIPKFAQALAKNEESKKCIAKYHLNFSENFKSIHEYYKKLLIEPETVNLKVDKFLKMFENEEVSAFVSSYKLRQVALQIIAQSRNEDISTENPGIN